MKIIVNIGDNSLAMTDEDLAALNGVLANTPVVNRYNNDEIQVKKRIKLEATMVVKTRTYEAP